jgi:hypothetical protein
LARVSQTSKARKLEGLIVNHQTISDGNTFTVEQMHKKGMPISYIASVTRYPYKKIIAIIDRQ